MTDIKYRPDSVKTCSKIITIDGSSHKRCFTGTFNITVNGAFLPIHLIYKKKSVQRALRFQFPEKFCLSATKKLFYNGQETMKSSDSDVL